MNWIRSNLQRYSSVEAGSGTPSKCTHHSAKDLGSSPWCPPAREKLHWWWNRCLSLSLSVSPPPLNFPLSLSNKDFLKKVFKISENLGPCGDVPGWLNVHIIINKDCCQNPGSRPYFPCAGGYTLKAVKRICRCLSIAPFLSHTPLSVSLCPVQLKRNRKEKRKKNLPGVMNL